MVGLIKVLKIITTIQVNYLKKDDLAESDIGNNMQDQSTSKILFTTISRYAILLNILTKIS